MWSQSVDVARWVRPAIEHAQDVLSGGSMISCGFSERSCYVITFYVGFMLVFLMFLWLCPFFKNQIVFVMGLSFDFFVFYDFFLRLYNSLQKNKLSSFKLG